MNKKIHLTILSPENIYFQGDILSVSVSTLSGDIEIFPNHAPLLTVIAPGFIRFHAEGEEEEKIFVLGGYVDISNNINIIADKILSCHDVTHEFLIEKQKFYADQIENATNIPDKDFDIAVDFHSKYTQLLFSDL